MTKYISILAALSLLVACTPDNNGGGGENQSDQDEFTIITGEVLDLTAYSATLIGYASLPVKLPDAEVGILYDKGQSFEDAKRIVASGTNENNMYTVSAIGLLPGTTYYYKFYAQNGTALKYGVVKSFTTKESKCPDGAVDLGIVIPRLDQAGNPLKDADGKEITYELYWSISNLSESGFCANPEDYGDYYAWGETEPYYTEGHSQDSPCDSWRSRMDPAITGYFWTSYKWCIGGSSYSMTKYFHSVDNKTVLDPEDDAAHVKLGRKWRMPTSAEWAYLRTQCTWTWTTKNGVNGRQVTASNGNSIFLPAAGSRFDADLKDVGSSGNYWSSSLVMDLQRNAYSTYFNSNRWSRDDFHRYQGFTIRPVTE